MTLIMVYALMSYIYSPVVQPPAHLQNKLLQFVARAQVSVYV